MQAKKREKKKNAAKEAVVQPSKDSKSGGGKEGSGVKRMEGVGKDKGGGVTSQRSQVLGRKVRWLGRKRRCSVAWFVFIGWGPSGLGLVVLL